jgi:hypothetical protein
MSEEKIAGAVAGAMSTFCVAETPRLSSMRVVGGVDDHLDLVYCSLVGKRLRRYGGEGEAMKLMKKSTERHIY